MDVHESLDFKVLNEEIFFEICGNIIPYDSLNDNNRKIGFLDAINGVQMESELHFYCLAKLDWSNAC